MIFLRILNNCIYIYALLQYTILFFKKNKNYFLFVVFFICHIFFPTKIVFSAGDNEPSPFQYKRKEQRALKGSLEESIRRTRIAREQRNHAQQKLRTCPVGESTYKQELQARIQEAKEICSTSLKESNELRQQIQKIKEERKQKIAAYKLRKEFQRARQQKSKVKERTQEERNTQRQYRKRKLDLIVGHQTEETEGRSKPKRVSKKKLLPKVVCQEFLQEQERIQKEDASRKAWEEVQQVQEIWNQSGTLHEQRVTAAILQRYYDKAYKADKELRDCLVCIENQKLLHIESLIRQTYRNINQAKEACIQTSIQGTSQALDPQQQQQDTSENSMLREQQHLQGLEYLLAALKRDREIQQIEVKNKLLALQIAQSICEQRQQRSTVIVSSDMLGVRTVLPMQPWNIIVQDVVKQPLQEPLHRTEPLVQSGQEVGASSEFFQDTTAVQLVEEVIGQEEEEQQQQQQTQKSSVACASEVTGLQLLIQAIEQQDAENEESSDTSSLCSFLTRSMYDSSSTTPSPRSLSESEPRSVSSLLESEEDEETEDVHVKRQRLSPMSLPPLSPSMPELEKSEDEEEEGVSVVTTHQHVSMMPCSPGEQSPSGQGTSMLFPYSMEGQDASLRSLHNTFLGTTEHIILSLKQLGLKAHAFNMRNSTMKGPASTDKKRIRSAIHRSYSALSETAFHSISQAFFEPQDVFAYSDRQQRNLEEKLSSAQVGFIVTPVSHCILGVAYDLTSDVQKCSDTATPHSGFATAKHITNKFSHIVAWNVGQAGYTGHVSGCYGWGNTKNVRYVAHEGNLFCFKGSPRTLLGGGLVHIGYTFLVGNCIRLTPYMEGIYALVQHSPYNERNRNLFSTVSKNKEKTWEKNIGVCSYWRVSNKAQLQAWISLHARRRSTKPLSVTSTNASMYVHTTSTELVKNRYGTYEIGCSYEEKITEACTYHIHSLLHIHPTNRSNEKKIHIFVEYAY